MHIDMPWHAYKALIDEPDKHLGWTNLPSSGFFSVKELSPYAEIFDPVDIDRMGDYEEIAEQWGVILATAHARADQDSNDYITTTNKSICGPKACIRNSEDSSGRSRLGQIQGQSRS
ncbi:Uncharacterized protein conserved in bacteria (DUF2252) [Seminavis robusta]|uniref:Uncharacterized protein conserved in bacteria (DUF2252) n=1 Tax=Seminavis robusta TaxID=568900 RepID=A0A9N8EDN0_9STRA|nr:Uncharacterized protein conserved in bacteria (DUF2252) [Seminavis robusta]|eukprot:Sro923_g220730.1 Uncharacterized protein conserved in bacteria (DUF2252) (117) ;mRNA; r:21277-21627